MTLTEAFNPIAERWSPVRVLVFSASLQRDSLNGRLARLAAQVITAHGGVVEFASMAEFDAVSYSRDVEVENGIPAGPTLLCHRLQSNDAFVIASPEYNGSMPGLLKNAIDWVSRFRPQPFNAHNCLLMSASPSMAGGNRGLWSLRIPLEHLGTRVYPDMFSLANAHKAFDDDGRISDEKLRMRFDETIMGFLNLVEADKHYPCAKKVWTEFLGEHLDPVTDRVQTG